MSSQSDTSQVFCNPVDLAYRYQDVRTPMAGRSVHREAADPTVVSTATGITCSPR